MYVLFLSLADVGRSLQAWQQHGRPPIVSCPGRNGTRREAQRCPWLVYAHLLGPMSTGIILLLF